METATNALKRKRFFWGVALAWVPFAFVVLRGIINTFKSFSEQKATAWEPWSAASLRCLLPSEWLLRLGAK